MTSPWHKPMHDWDILDVERAIGMEDRPKRGRIERRLTNSQLKALAWLPADGSWTIQSPGRLSAAINSLTLFHKDLAEAEWGDFGPRGGRCLRLRLTRQGVELRLDRGI